MEVRSVSPPTPESCRQKLNVVETLLIESSNRKGDKGAQEVKSVPAPSGTTRTTGSSRTSSSDFWPTFYGKRLPGGSNGHALDQVPGLFSRRCAASRVRCDVANP